MSFHVPRPSRIWKHPLQSTEGELIRLALPLGAEVIHFARQHGTVCLWEVHPIDGEERVLNRTFWFTGTGHEIPGWLVLLKHAGTFQESPFVWHLFEVADQRNNLEPKEISNGST